MKQRIIIGISGATGFIYGVRLLEILKEQTHIETHLIVTKAAQRTRVIESDLSWDDLQNLADVVHPYHDIYAAIASGSYKTMGMIIAPCSLRTMAEIESGVTSNLLSRAADVVLKERRRLVLLLRETPLHTGHLHKMLRLSQMGAIVAPPVPAFYNHPQTISDIVNHSVGRALDLFDFDFQPVKRWNGPDKPF